MKTFTLSIAAMLALNSFAAAGNCDGNNANFGARFVGTVAAVRESAAERLAGRREHRAEVRDAHAAARLEAHAKAKAGTGCSGGGFSQVQTVTTRTVVKVPPPRSTSCSGGTFGTVAVVPAPEAPPALMEAGPVQRIIVHRQLHKALRQGNLSPADAAMVEKVIANPKLYDKSVDAATKIIRGKHAAAAPGTMQALGDGHILQMLLQNLPAIIDAIKQILALFAAADNAPAVPGWLPMPAGPPAPVIRVPAYSLAC